MVSRTVGHYRIEEKLGEGGMGVVYRATDLRLNRSVAIKFLPASCAKDPERRARFEREARLLAALDDPNIAQIHGLEDCGGETCCLVLEYVPGQTLAERLAAKSLEMDEGLRLACGIAAALEAAHEKGIIHRDLKPANVKITPEGKIKVLDFGLAKTLLAEAAAEEASAAPTRTEETREGVIVGTAAYMSPEQARGKPLDKRTDIWSFGCVLYEILARRRPFDGETFSDFIAAILGQEPDWKALPQTIPGDVRALLRRCLQKEPQRRLRDIGDARMELEDALAGAGPPEVGPAVRSRLRVAVLAGVCLLVGTAAASFVAGKIGRGAVPAVMRFSIPLAVNEVVHPLAGSGVAISQDGSRIVYAGNKDGRTQLYLRTLDRLEAKPLPGTVGGAAPFFSPDGQWVGFRYVANRTVRKVALSGGAPLTVVGADAFAGATWGAHDQIILNDQYPGGLDRVPAGGGTLLPVTRIEGEQRLHKDPVLLPGGKAVLFTVAAAGMDSYDDAQIAVVSLATGERKVLVQGGTSAEYSPSGHLVYARNGSLLAVPFDLSRLEVTGPPVDVLDGVFMCASTGIAHFQISESGSLVYAPGRELGDRTLVWVDRLGKEQPLPLPPRSYLHPRLSPDSRELAVEIEGPTHDLWTYDFARGTMTKMSLGGVSHSPLWTPDSSKLTYRLWGPGGFTMWWMPADHSAEPVRLTSFGKMQSPESWSPDGKVVAFTQVNAETGPDVYVLDIREGKPRPFAQTKFAEGSPKFSSDGRWIAYTSNESGRNEIYAQAYPGPGARVQISTDGGTDAVWRRAGSELYYRNGDKMMAVSVSASGAFSRPGVLWQGRYAHGLGSACGAPGATSSNYDVTADGQRFLMLKDDETAPAQINVVLNWAEELKRLYREKAAARL